jgi:hypothetical protein
MGVRISTVNWEEYGNNNKPTLQSDGKTHNQVDHTLIDRWHMSILDVLRWHLSILDVLSSMGADYDNDHYLLVAKVGKDWQ